MMVDTHIHPLADDLQKYPIAPIGGRQSDWSIGAHLTAEEFIKHMDAGGVDQATLVQASTVHGYDNNFCADCAARYPDRFVGVCCIDPLAPGAPDTLSHWVTDRGMRGLRLFTVGSSVAETGWLDDPQTFPMWERARSLGIPVDVQIRLTGVPMLRRLLERFADVPMILDHLINPPMEDGPPYNEAKELFALAEFPKIYLKFTTNNIKEASKGRSTPQAFFQALIDRFGANRLLWGTNFPGTKGSPDAPYKELAEFARDSFTFLSAENRNWLLGETALSLYPKLRGAGK